MNAHRIRHPCYTGLVFDFLVAADDFRSFAAIREATRCSSNQITAALHSLQQYRAVDCVAAPDGLHWFATPSTDTRIRTITEIADHTRKAGRRRAIKPLLKDQLL